MWQERKATVLPIQALSCEYYFWHLLMHKLEVLTLRAGIVGPWEGNCKFIIYAVTRLLVTFSWHCNYKFDTANQFMFFWTTGNQFMFFFGQQEINSCFFWTTGN
jgi:hypothetical protein